jgi:hypothetical protein
MPFDEADGNIRLYRNYESSRVDLVAAFRALTDIVPSQYRQAGLVAEWQQGRGHLLVGGNVKAIRVWDAPKEMCTQVTTFSVPAFCPTYLTRVGCEGHTDTFKLVHDVADVGPSRRTYPGRRFW